MDPSRWPPHGQNGDQAAPPSHPSSSTYSLLTTYPFASTLPTSNSESISCHRKELGLNSWPVQQHLNTMTTNLTDVRPPPTILHPQYYDQVNPTPHSEHGPARMTPQQTLDGAGQGPFWQANQQRAFELLLQQQRSEGYRRVCSTLSYFFA